MCLDVLGLSGLFRVVYVYKRVLVWSGFQRIPSELLWIMWEASLRSWEFVATGGDGVSFLPSVECWVWSVECGVWSAQHLLARHLTTDRRRKCSRIRSSAEIPTSGWFPFKFAENVWWQGAAQLWVQPLSISLKMDMSQSRATPQGHIRKLI